MWTVATPAFREKGIPQSRTLTICKTKKNGKETAIVMTDVSFCFIFLSIPRKSWEFPLFPQDGNSGPPGQPCIRRAGVRQTPPKV